MFDKLRIGDSAKAAQKFTPVHPNPAIGTTHGISLMMHGKHSEEYRNAIAAMLRRTKKGEDQTAEDAINESAKLIAACCDGWEGVDQKFSQQELEKLLTDDDFRWLRLQAEKFMQQDDNFF